jgi:hypothetical protein
MISYKKYIISMLLGSTQDHNKKRPYNILKHRVMASYQCSGPIYRITIKGPYNILEHRVMASYQCSGPIYRITITRPRTFSCNGLISMPWGLYTGSQWGPEHFRASSNGLISMLGPIYRITITRYYNVLEHRVMASYQCSGPIYRITMRPRTF